MCNGTNVILNILVLQLKRIGDLVLTTPALAALRAKFPQARITLVVSESARELLPALDFVDEKLTVSGRGSNWRLWLRVFLRYFDVCLDFTGNDRSAFLTFLSKAKKRVTFEWVRKSKMRAFFYNDLVDSSVRDLHTADHYLDLLQSLAISERGLPITLHLPEWACKKAGQILSEASVVEPFVIVHPGTARPEKFWLPERWAEVIRFCREELKMECVLTGVNSDLELPHLKKIESLLERPCPNLSGRLDLLSFAALTARSALFLSVDSGPMHLAAAAGVPQVALFGTTNPFHWRPRHARAAVILAGSPLANPELRPKHRGLPMDEVSTEQVIAAIKSLFADF